MIIKEFKKVEISKDIQENFDKAIEQIKKEYEINKNKIPKIRFICGIEV